MWVELSGNFCHLSDIIRPPLRTNSLYEKPTVVFSPHTPCGRVRLARFTLEDHAYGASRLPKRPKTTVLQSTCRELCLAIDFLIDNIYVQVIGIPMGTDSAPLLANLFLHTFECDFMLRTMKQDMNKAVQFCNTFRYIDDLFSVNNEHFGHYINVIYPSELELNDTTLTSNEVCYLDTRIKTGDNNKNLSILVPTTRGMTSHSGLLTSLILTATSPPTRPTVFTYLNW